MCVRTRATNASVGCFINLFFGVQNETAIDSDFSIPASQNVMMIDEVSMNVLEMFLVHVHTNTYSFSMMAIFFPWFVVRMWLMRVVFPDPKKPVITVTGIFFEPSSFVLATMVVIEKTNKLILLGSKEMASPLESFKERAENQPNVSIFGKPISFPHQ